MRFRRRHRRGFVAAAVLSLLVTAGCGSAADLDGDLTDDWGLMAAAIGFQPVSLTCHSSGFAGAGPRASYEEVDCNTRHRTETVHVGEYTAPAAQAPAPPTGDSAGARAAYRTCDAETTEYVGGPWRTARLWIGVTNPSPEAWRGGARWFRCEVVELDSVEDDGGQVQRAGSLRHSLVGGSSELLLTCYAVALNNAGAIAAMPPASCAQPHNGEFVGLWDASVNAVYPRTDTTWAEFHDGCRGMVAAYVGVPNDGDLQYRTGVVSLPGSAEVWTQGDHSVRCYLWLAGAELTGSLKGKGTKALPVQYE
ncbi:MULTISPECIES: septum formation family protein [Actinoplanes]|uniref:septum formation family protein n=1 Tax=Actinoplanes TaxID=1865 RepID=UPI0005F2C88F|nr:MULTISPECIES: septum formation family protein [Actinoplanes]